MTTAESFCFVFHVWKETPQKCVLVLQLITARDIFSTAINFR